MPKFRKIFHFLANDDGAKYGIFGDRVLPRGIGDDKIDGGQNRIYSGVRFRLVPG